ncbi:DUF4026 domain-containing protein [Anaerosacchariphilus polymeriproducens]|uniref:DUF4026 domain-containing protein n=1 Tax=Anaerosacchariphilus polymeriproducens TaxID=1812858 RepID=A0A371AQW5_9FIRM|nr:DUF4026 domain-containing protein [Anaerosacchariphilus polymeriproducens]RDU21975.1 DUF4026 domain-containing protein [Anaerosacchariphilus polymeriproducens]
MGLFEKFSNKNQRLEDLKKGKIEKVPSYVMAIPKNDIVLDDLELMVDQIRKIEGLTIIGKRINNILTVVFKYKNLEYSVDIFVEDFQLPPLFRITHDFGDEEVEIMEGAVRGLLTRMTFSENKMDSFHIQIKLLYAMIPELAGVVDFSAEKILSGKWVELTAKSNVHPAPSYLYTIQAVTDKNEVWLHTHGMNRCGSIELEVLKSDKINFNNHYEVLASFAERMITDNVTIDEGEALYIGTIGSNQDLVVTWIDFKRVIKKMKRSALGGTKDRIDGHNENSGIIFVYPTEEDYNIKKMVHISQFNSLLNQNPVFMKTTEETIRMQNLALERIPFLHKLWKAIDEKQVLIKVGMKVNEEYNSSDNKEHIWFEVIDLGEKTFRGILLQEAYYITNLRKGDEFEFPIEELTDWLAYTKIGTIKPDNVYRLLSIEAWCEI